MHRSGDGRPANVTPQTPPTGSCNFPDRLLDDAERALAEPLFIRLVRLGDTGGATRRLATRAEFDDAGWHLVQKLASKAGKRLVLIGGSETGGTAEIAHEALVTQWPRYQNWLSGRDPDGTERAADKRTLDGLTPRAADWAAAADPSAKAKRLATGADLEGFASLAERRPAWLSIDEHDFVSASREAAVRQQRRERWLFRAAVAAAVAAIMAAGGAWQQRNHAVAEARRAETQTGKLLAAEAQRRLGEPITEDTSALVAALATAGWRKGKSSDAWNAMQRVPLVTTLAQVPHNAEVTRAIFSSDGAFLATLSGSIGNDQEVRVVAADGREAARIKHRGFIEMMFSPDGKSLATVSDRVSEEEVRVVAVPDGHELANFTHKGSLALSPDWKYMAVADWRDSVRVVTAADGREVARVSHTDYVTRLAFSPDSRALAIVGDAPGVEQQLAIATVPEGRELARIPHGYGVNELIFSADGRFLATASKSRPTGGKTEVRITSLATGQEIARVAQEKPVGHIIFSPNGELLAIATDELSGKGEARVVAVADGRELARVEHEQAISQMVFSPDGKSLATASYDRTARIVTVPDGRELARVSHAASVSTVGFSPDSKLLATGGLDRVVRIVEVEDGREIARIIEDDVLDQVVFSPDGTLATVTGLTKRQVRILAVDDDRALARVGHRGPVQAVAFSGDGKWLATASLDKTARIVAVSDGREAASVPHRGLVSAIAFSPSGRLLATGTGTWDGGEGQARILSVPDGREIGSFAHDEAVHAVALSPDGEFLATASGDPFSQLTGNGKGEARVLVVKDGRELARVAHDLPVTKVIFSPDGKWIATATADAVRVAAAATGRERFRIKNSSITPAIAFSPDGRFLSVGGSDGTARILEAIDGNELARVAHEGSIVAALAFSPNGRFLATAAVGAGFGKGAKGEVRIVSVPDGDELARLSEATHSFLGLSFSDDSRFLALAGGEMTLEQDYIELAQKIGAVFDQSGRGADPESVMREMEDPPRPQAADIEEMAEASTRSVSGDARILSVPDGREVARFTHRRAVSSAVFNPDGTLLATGSMDGVVRLWSAALNDMTHQLCADRGRNLSLSEWRRYLGDLPWQPTCESWPTPPG